MSIYFVCQVGNLSFYAKHDILRDLCLLMAKELNYYPPYKTALYVGIHEWVPQELDQKIINIGIQTEVFFDADGKQIVSGRFLDSARQVEPFFDFIIELCASNSSIYKSKNVIYGPYIFPDYPVEYSDNDKNDKNIFIGWVNKRRSMVIGELSEKVEIKNGSIFYCIDCMSKANKVINIHSYAGKYTEWPRVLMSYCAGRALVSETFCNEMKKGIHYILIEDKKIPNFSAHDEKLIFENSKSFFTNKKLSSVLLKIAAKKKSKKNVLQKKLKTFIFRLTGLLDRINGAASKFFSIKIVAPLLFFFVSKKFPPKFNVLSHIETLDLVDSRKMSIIRFGDGEIKIIAGEDLGFQKTNSKLVNELKIVANLIDDKICLCVPDVFHGLDKYKDVSANFWRLHLTKYFFLWTSLFKGKQYGNSFITRPYMDYKDKSTSLKVFERIKEMLQFKDVFIIEGEKTNFGVNNDLLIGCRSIHRIICSAENAHSQHNEILECAKEIPISNLIIISLGPAGKYLGYLLVKMGYRVFDLGHLDVEYEWFRMGTNDKMLIAGKHVNEVGSASDVENLLNIPADQIHRIL